jgi:hypothetical protein
VYEASAAGRRPFFDRNMPRQLSCIRKNYSLANEAIVCHMRVCHNEASRAYARYPVVCPGVGVGNVNCAAVNCCKFPDGAIVSKLCESAFTSEKFQVLRHVRNYGRVVNLAALADARTIADENMMMNFRIASDLNVAFDYCIRADLYVFG